MKKHGAAHSNLTIHEPDPRGTRLHYSFLLCHLRCITEAREGRNAHFSVFTIPEKNVRRAVQDSDNYRVLCDGTDCREGALIVGKELMS